MPKRIGWLLFLLAMLQLRMFAGGFDWPGWRGPEHNGISRETNWLTQWPAAGPTRLWKTSIGIGFSSFAVVGSRVLTLGHSGDTDIVYCLDAEKGTALWKHPYPAKLDPRLYEGGPNATPAVKNAHVYTLGRQGQVQCLKLADGTPVWTRDLMKDFGLTEPGQDWWGFSGSPLIYENVVILNAGSHGIALDRETGKTVWSSGTGAASYASPVPFTIGEVRGVAIFGAKALFGVDARTGKKLWELPWKTSYDINAADPIFAQGHLFVSSGYRTGGVLYRMEGSPFPQVWKSQEMHNQLNPSVYLDGNLYGISGQNGYSGDLRCVEFMTGKVRWKEPAAGMGSFIIAGGHIILLTEKGELLVAPASPDEFKPTGRVQVLGGRCWTSPVLSHGLIFCRNARGDMVCLDVRRADATQTIKP